MGDESLCWREFQRLVTASSLARIMNYHRAGPGCSEPSLCIRNAENMTIELDASLDVANLPNP